MDGIILGLYMYMIYCVDINGNSNTKVPIRIDYSINFAD